ncbi:hypothetical protein BJF80_07845 [Serinicoccus sp. CUA-874]|uniref:hypothetical protein n=1 Tax=Serinicoccus TaxID=265976 RepID=UPI0003B4EAEA|nr:MULTISPECIES: hypothetical protein [Serinicoccus]OLT15881.1 hypothetical protein BJF80_07845 [Serinicoccus sp. CUA-874]
MPDHELPASVRVALWATAAYAGRIDVSGVAPRALPDLDHVEGLAEPLAMWQSLGERAVLVALPRPGDLSGMPSATGDLHAAASAARECVFIPGLGGALVPDFERFGPEGDQGWAVRFELHGADPYPTHRVEALDLGQLELSLRTELAAHTQTLAATGGAPFGAAADRALDRLRALADADRWGLPPGLPGRAERLIGLAATVLRLTEAGLDPDLESVDLATTSARGQTLRRLHAQAATSLADATNTAVLHLAGWR